MGSNSPIKAMMMAVKRTFFALVMLGLVAHVQGKDIVDQKEAGNFRQRTMYLEPFEYALGSTQAKDPTFGPAIKEIADNWKGENDFATLLASPLVQENLAVLNEAIDFDTALYYKNGRINVCMEFLGENKNTEEGYGKALAKTGKFPKFGFDEPNLDQGGQSTGVLKSAMARKATNILLNKCGEGMTTDRSNPEESLVCVKSMGGAQPGTIQGATQVDFNKKELSVFKAAMQKKEEYDYVCPLFQPEGFEVADTDLWQELNGEDRNGMEGKFGTSKTWFTPDNYLICDGKMQSLGFKLVPSDYGVGFHMWLYACTGGASFNNYV